MDKTDKRKLLKQVKNFGKSLHDLTKHGSYSYLRFGTHRCKQCILRKNKRYNVYSKTIDHNGEKMRVGLNTECLILESYVDNIISQTMALDHIQESDILSVHQLARALGFVAIANKYLNEMGMFLVGKNEKTVSVQPLVSQNCS